jgi:hypothetical protein
MEDTEVQKPELLHVAVKKYGKDLELISINRDQFQSWLQLKIPLADRDYLSSHEKKFGMLFTVPMKSHNPIEPCIRSFVERHFKMPQSWGCPNGFILFCSGEGDSISDETFDWLHQELKINVN